MFRGAADPPFERGRGSISRYTTAAILLGVTACFGATARAAAPESVGAPATRAESAVWTPRQLNFVYQGFTAQYSCEGLRERVTDLLRRLGARGDLEVHESGCASINSPDPFPGVRITMSVLQPTGRQGAAAEPNAAAVPAHWQRVDLSSGRNALAAGECELLDQVRAQILPLFATRNVAYGSNCQPHQLQIGASWLQADVLLPDPTPAAQISRTATQ